MNRSQNVFNKLRNIRCSTNVDNIPTRKGFPFIGTTLSIIASGSAPKLHKYIHERHKESGPVFRENMGNVTAVSISDPEIMRFIFSVEGKYPKHFLPQAWTLYNKIYNCKRGLFFMDGEEWSKHRKLLNKHFLKNDLSDLKDVQNVIVEDLIKRWRRFDGGVVEDIEHEFYRHSLSFVLGSMIGSNYINKRDEYEENIDKLAKIFQSIFETSSKLQLQHVGLAYKMGLKSWTNFESAVNNSLDLSRAMVKKIVKHRSPDGLLGKIMDENIDFDTTVAIVADLLLAAGDTTANASQWILYLLSKNRHTQISLLENPNLIKGVVKETLRLYPPAIFITRYLPETVKFKKYTFHKDELLMLSLYTAGRNRDLYLDPENFIPERWLTRGKSTNQNFFLPFAMGIRSCIGAKIALSLLHTTTKEIVKNYKLTVKEDVDMILKLVPVPEKKLQIFVNTRN